MTTCTSLPKAGLLPPAKLPAGGFHYVVSGFPVVADLELPSAVPIAQPFAGQPAVSIAAGNVPRHLRGALRTGPDWEAGEDTFLLRVEGAARFLISRGESILYQQEPGYAGNDLPLFLLGTCLAVLLQQRGSVVLHASAVAVGGRAMLFCGESGAGKSTLAALLCLRGYPLLNDDTCSLQPSPAGFTVCADGRMLKLWEQSIRHLALCAQRGPAVRTLTDKFYLQPPIADTSPRTFESIFLLERCPDDEPPTLAPLSRAQSIAMLQQNSYRPALIRAMNLQTSYFAASAALLGQGTFFRLRRPLHFGQSQRTLHLLEHHWASSSSPLHAGA